MNKLGLLGKNISYSFSKGYFENKFKELHISNYSYDIFDLQDINKVNSIFEKPNLRGFNITIPYKESIIPFLDELSDEAKNIGAVNCVLIKNKKRIGYNTDAYGFQKSLETKLNKTHKKALILGDGGASKAVQYTLNQLHIPFKIISRKGENTFENLTKSEVEKHTLIIQTTPVGTFPTIDNVLEFPFDGLSENHLVMDLIYNPEKTKFLELAEKHNADILNGLQMLHNQADKAWTIWNF